MWRKAPRDLSKLNSVKITVSIKMLSETLKNTARINIILGKNGCGKSLLLKKLEQDLGNKRNEVGMVRYISPERGGELSYQSGVQDAIENDKMWLQNQRRNTKI